MIQIQPIITSNLNTLKTAIEKIAREAQALQSVGGQEDEVYVSVPPTVANTKEGQFVLYFDGLLTYRVYVKVNNIIKYWALT